VTPFLKWLFALVALAAVLALAAYVFPDFGVMLGAAGVLVLGLIIAWNMFAA
jgi:hypothetical protein